MVDRDLPTAFFFSATREAGELSVADDSDLITAALRGDRSAFEGLVRRYQDRLFAAMVQVTSSPEEAEDVVQDAFVRAFLKLNTFQNNSQFFTWLYRIAFNSALSRMRRRRGTTSLDQAREDIGDEPVDSLGGPDSRMLRDERVRMVQMALDRLSDDHRSILVLREMEDHPYEQIAEILEISIGTVRSRLSRARAQLKAVLEEMERADEVPKAVRDTERSERGS
jgi:RNA polymerase sigma-70 factor (ECF subfamily)